MQTTLIVAMAIVAAAVAAVLVVRSRRRRRRVVPDDLRPVIIEKALRRARTKQRAAFHDALIRHDRAS